MKRVVLLLCAWLLSTQSVFAAEAPGIREAFGCSFRDGKTFDDFNVAAQTFKTAIGTLDKNTTKDYRVFLWAPYRGVVDIDLVWSSYFADIRAYGRFSAAVEGSPKASAAVAKLGEIADCSSILQSNEVMYRGKDVPDSDPPALIQAFRCKLNEGKTTADARAASQQWAKHIGTIPSYANALGSMRTPIVGGGRFDLGYVVVHENTQQFANRLADFQSSKGAAAISAKLSEAARCESALFLGTPLI